MTRDIYKNLSWLLPPDEDFNLRCKEILAATDDISSRLRTMANTALNDNQLNKLAKLVYKIKHANKKIPSFTPLRLALIGNCTTSFIVPALIGSALRYGIDLECIEGGYDQAVQDATDASSNISQWQPDIVLVFLDYHGLFLKGLPGNLSHTENTVSMALNYIDAIQAGIKLNTNAICIFQTIVRPEETMFGNLERMLPGTSQYIIEHFNAQLRRKLHDSDDVLLDVAALAETVGLENWHSPKLWNYGKIPFDSQYIPLYSDYICRLIAALKGKSRRCMVLDLDNTLWGGVIGDDGIEGIILGQGNATGEAHLALQHVALRLRERGLILAICSKNTDDVARKPFREHPDMLLKEEHIAIFQANWQDKATNIKAIAANLNLGLESLVFIDDNPVERDLVRRTLPEVAVPELPQDPAYYVRTILAAGYFESHIFLEEDRKRATYYEDNAKRISVQKSAGNIASFLESLQMRMTLQPFDAPGRSRIAQLINKSNQFNLTTYRYTEAEINEIQEDPNFFHWQIRLADSFGDNGMISVVICQELNHEWHINTWLMSCRVIGRKVEHAVLNELIAVALAKGITKLCAIYIPTERNVLVKNHYDTLGFEVVELLDNGVCHYMLKVAEYVPETLPILVNNIEYGEMLCKL